MQHPQSLKNDKGALSIDFFEWCSCSEIVFETKKMFLHVLGKKYFFPNVSWGHLRTRVNYDKRNDELYGYLLRGLSLTFSCSEGYIFRDIFRGPWPWRGGTWGANHWTPIHRGHLCIPPKRSATFWVVVASPPACCQHASNCTIPHNLYGQNVTFWMPTRKCSGRAGAVLHAGVHLG